MKDIIMFMFDGCPHCRLAKDYIQKLFEENPEYKQVPFRMIDEHKNPEIAEKYDYYYVPTFYVGGKKVHEGHAEMEDVKAVFKMAYDWQ